MKYQDSHLSDRQLLLDLESELSAHDQKLAREHLAACWKCRARSHELQNAISDFVRIHQQELDSASPLAPGPRALLKAQLAKLPAAAPAWNWFAFPRRFAWPLAAATCGLMLLGLLLVRTAIRHQDDRQPQARTVSTPDSKLTPGAALLVSRQDVCAQQSPKNKVVPVALQRKVFEEYGIARAEPRAYEVDYLVTPALGGADDIHNLWPHSYSATVWNAQVKDALEDRLREMVCGGTLDLTEAQREIATNWIAAYKKYFHTDQPLENPATRP